jgi:hypothetical protein
MTRWSLRRLFGGTRDAESGYRHGTAASAARPRAALQEPAPQPPAGPPADPARAPQQGPGQQSAGWFEPIWGGNAPSGTGPQGTYGFAEPGAQSGPGPHGSGPYPYGPGEYAGSQSGAAVLAPVPPPAGPPLRSAVPSPALPSSLVPSDPYSPDAAPGAAAPPPPEGGLAPAWAARAEPGPADPAGPWPGGPRGPWPGICDQYGLHLLVLAEQLRVSLDELEADEADPERLRRLYQVDHAVTRMRRASRDLRTLAGRSEEELAGFTTSLLDVIRMAASAIERYKQITVGRVTELAVLGYAADDVGSLMAVLLDNATRYSPGTVTVSGHLLEDGCVMFRIEDTGIGLAAEQVTALNAVLAGPVPEVDDRTGRHTGFPVAHRIARKHSIGIRLATRPGPSSGTIAMVTLPPQLLCEVPEEEAVRPPEPAVGAAQPGSRPGTVTPLSRSEPTRPQQVPPRPRQWEPNGLPGRDLPRRPGELPRRERASLRGDGPRPADQAPPLTSQQQSAARRAFAEELSAFSLGAGSPAAGGAAADIAIEEEVKP